MENERHFGEKNLFKLNNGYILEFSEKEQSGFGKDKLVFSVFFNEFDNHYVLQTIRKVLIIRKDKEKDSVEPYIKGIIPKSRSKKILLSKCLETLEKLVEEDTINEKQFNKTETPVKKLVQDYFLEDLYTFVNNPILTNYINLGTKN